MVNLCRRMDTNTANMHFPGLWHHITSMLIMEKGHYYQIPRLDNVQALLAKRHCITIA